THAEGKRVQVLKHLQERGILSLVAGGETRHGKGEADFHLTFVCNGGATVSHRIRGTVVVAPSINKYNGRHCDLLLGGLNAPTATSEGAGAPTPLGASCAHVRA